MTSWFSRLPLHRKLVAIALAVTTVAMVMVLAGLLVVDVLRYRATVEEDTRVLAEVIASNTRASVIFDVPDDARDMLAATRARSDVSRACIYLADGTLFAAFARSEARPCGDRPPTSEGLFSVIRTAAIMDDDRPGGIVYVERELGGAWPSVAITTGVGLLLLVTAGLLAIPLANRLSRSVSEPIVRLARAARQTAAVPSGEPLPPIDVNDDEVGELVRAFSEMLNRVTDANESLRLKEAEREELLARERRANRLKDEFLAAVSHELRTPLNAMLGWVQILSQSAVNEQLMARGMASISRNARAQTRVIEDLVDVSRIVSGKLSLRIDAVDLREPAADAVDEIRSAAEARRIDMSMTLPETPCMVSGDRDRLRQVISNLLSNAVKFTPTGGSVSLTLRYEGRHLAVEVRDTGIGIAREFLPYVFDRFRQADGSNTREHGGLGLGLAIVKEIATLHGGSVEVTSEGRGAGSTFTVRLPALLDVECGTVASGGDDQALPTPLAGLRVLAVDDNADALDLLVTALERAGARVHAVDSGAAAVEQWQRARPDVLLCDLSMPGMDGFAVLRRIRELEAGGPATAAVAVSAHASEEQRAASLAAGFLAHVTKPYEVAELVLATRRAAGAEGDGRDATGRTPAGSGGHAHV